MALLLGSGLGGDGDYRIESFFTKWGDYNYIVDEELNDLYQSTLKTLDPAERERILKQLGRMTNERAYKLFMWFYHVTFGVGPRIAEWTPNRGETPTLTAQSIKLR